MRLIITESINKTEFLPCKKIFSLKIIQTAAKKALRGIGKQIKSSAKIPKTRLQKLSLTSSGGAGRVIFLLETSSEISVLVILKNKKDKTIGRNMTIKNPRFKKMLERNIDLVLRDIIKKNYEEYEL